MTRTKLNFLFILSVSLLSTCMGKSGILNFVAKLDPRIQSIKFWADLIIPELFGDDTTKKILTEVKTVSGQISEMRGHLDQRLDIITKSIPARVRADSRVDDSVKIIENEINHIDDLYDIRLARLLAAPNDAGTQQGLIETVLSPTKDVSASVNNMYHVIVKERTLALSDDFLTQVKNQLELVGDERCDDTVSPHMWLYDIYINVLITEVRAYILNIIAYSIKSQLTHVSYNHTMSSLTKELSERLVKYVTTIRPKLAVLPRDIRRCDPKQHTRGKTFIEFEKVLQPFIVNEDQFGHNHKCVWCATLPPHGSALVRRQKFINNYPVNRQCNGTVFGCRSYGRVFHSGGEVCLLPENSVKRYEWIKSPSNGVNYGNVRHCGGEIKKLDDHSYSEHHGGPMPGLYPDNTNHCSYCLCICAEENHYRNLRAISILETYTNIEENMVIVGIQIVQRQKVIHLRVKQGKLLPGGRIDPHSVSWKPVIDMDYYRKVKTIKFATYQNEMNLVEYEDYVHIDKYGFNFVLEDLMAEKNSIILGVRFKPFEYNSVKGIKLQIATAPFNWTSAKINTNFHWQSLDSSKPLKEARNNPSTIKEMKDLDDPLKSLNNKPGLNNKVIKFSMSSIHRDAGQSMVPFFDALPVETIPAMPLAGITVFHKTDADFGGYISLKVHNMDVTDHVDIVNAH